jgi:hypothetical protein
MYRYNEGGRPRLTRERVSGEIRTVPRYLFIFEGFESYHPSQTELGLAEVGDEYIVVTYATSSTRAVRLYRADAYLWDETLGYLKGGDPCLFFGNGAVSFC